MPDAYPLRTRWWTRPLLVLVTRAPLEARVEDGVVRITMGWVGRAEVPVEIVDRIGRMNWPWWAGFGARIGGKGLVAFVGSPGPTVLLELSRPVPVKAPFRWQATRVAVGAADAHAFSRAVAEARIAADRAGEAPREGRPSP